jgi:hypothetical protein
MLIPSHYYYSKLTSLSASSDKLSVIADVVESEMVNRGSYVRQRPTARHVHQRPVELEGHISCTTFI